MFKLNILLQMFKLDILLQIYIYIQFNQEVLQDKQCFWFLVHYLWMSK